MEEKKKGGKRKNAGRKPVADKKIPVVLYVQESVVNAQGGKSQFGELLLNLYNETIPTLSRQLQENLPKEKSKSESGSSSKRSDRENKVTERDKKTSANQPPVDGGSSDDVGQNATERADLLQVHQSMIEKEEKRLWDAVPRNLNRIQRIGWVSRELDVFKEKNGINI